MWSSSQRNEMDKAFVWEGTDSQSPLPLCRWLDPFGYFHLYSNKKGLMTHRHILRALGATEGESHVQVFYKVKYDKVSRRDVSGGARLQQRRSRC